MTVLVAYDGSAPAQKAATYAFRQFPEEDIVLLRIVEAAEGSTGAGIELVREFLEERMERASNEMDEEVEDLDAAADADYRTDIAVGDPAREVVEYAEDHAVEHIIVGNHGRSGVSRVLLGSVAEDIVRRAPVPVTVVR